MRLFLLSCLFLLSFVRFGFCLPRYEADVSVDITAKTVGEAKNKAMSKAIRDGLNEVVLNISTEKTVEELNKLNDNQIEHFITGVMVLMEKSSDVRYIADLRISVDGELLKAYIAENNLPLVISGEADIVLIPVLEDEEGNIDVWEEDNFWREAFLDKPFLHRGNMNFRLIDKNLGNLTAIKANRVLEMNEAEYQEILNFNKADEICVLKYSLKDKAVIMKSYPDLRSENIKFDDKNIEELAKEAMLHIKGVSKKEISDEDEGSALQQVEVVYDYPKLTDWMKLKQILEANPQAQDIRILSMGNGKVHFNFKYSGVLEKLQGGLAVSGYKMRQEGAYYVIN